MFLNIVSLSQTFKKQQVLKSISFHAELGSIVAFLGPNGAGKTTLLKTVMGLYQAPAYTENRPNNSLEDNTEKTGTNLIMLDNTIINNLPVHKRVEHGLLYLPQQTSLFQQMTVLDNLKLVYEYQTQWAGKPWALFKEEMDHWLEQTTLTPALHKYAGTLSGGQKRKLEVVRSILMRPRALMLDEPFAGVDPKSIYELKKIFTDMAAQNIAVIISDHHVDQLLSIAQLIYVVLHGEIVTSGTIKEVLENRYTKESYLGNQFYNEISTRFL